MQAKYLAIIFVLIISILPVATAGSAQAWPVKGDETFSSQEQNLQAAPVIITSDVRRPLIYFRQVANRRWRVGLLFAFLFSLSGIFKLFLPRLTEAAAARCRSSFFGSLASAFIFATTLIAIIRFSFTNADLNAMGIFSFGFLQLSFALGSCFGVNLFAQNLYGKLFAVRTANAGPLSKICLYALCLAAIAGLMCAITLIPDLGPLPRPGNRIVMIIAALGLGGLVNLAAVSSKKLEP